MPLKPMVVLALALGIALASWIGPTCQGADDKGKPKVNFQDHVAPIFASRCNSCHNADKAKGGLALETFGLTMQGGSSGKVIEPGDTDGSHLWGLVNQTEEPKMPPKSSRIPDAELAVIKAWIEGGALETSGSVAAVKAKPKFDFKLDPSSLGKPIGPPAMPEGILTEPFVLSPRPTAIVAISASPWAPLVAVAGHKQVLLYQANKDKLVGVLPFPEGTVHVLKFSRNGSLLLAGGGRGGQSGLAVVFDVKTGKRVFEIGKEYDVVLAADISPDHGQVALGGPSKVVRVYNTADGQLQFEMKKHTEWVTALEFSPDGVLLATGDRNNGLFVWEAQTGREFFDLRGHTASITDITWRLDSNVVASSSEDGSVKLWEMENGNPIKSWGAHGGGVASARFAKDGRIVTTGRDRMVRVWDQNGGKQREFEPFGDLALRAVFALDDSRVVAGDWSGEVRVWDAKDGKRLANLPANPEPIAARLARAQGSAQAAQVAAEAASKELAPLVANLEEKSNGLARAQTTWNEAQSDAQRKLEAVASAEKLDAEKAKAASQASDALKLAQAALDKANHEKATAEKAIAETVAAEKAALEAIAASKLAVEKALNEKLAQDPTLASAVETLKSSTTKAAADQAGATLSQAIARSSELNTNVLTVARRQVEALGTWEKAVATRTAAPGLFDAAVARAKVASEALAIHQDAATRTNLERASVAKIMGDAQTVSQVAKATAEARKRDLDASAAAKVAAEKALSDRKPAADVLTARAAELKLEVEALASELKASEAARASNAATASNKGG